MTIALTAIFGTNIKVGFQPRKPVLQLTGFPGANGLVGMHLGSRGYPIFVTGQLTGGGESYTLARQSLIATITTIGSYIFADPASYSFSGTIYDYVIFTEFRLIPDENGKFFHYNAAGNVTCQFVAGLLSLL